MIEKTGQKVTSKPSEAAKNLVVNKPTLSSEASAKISRPELSPPTFPPTPKPPSFSTKVAWQINNLKQRANAMLKDHFAKEIEKKSAPTISGITGSTATTTLPNGLKIVQHYDPSRGTPDSQCGPVSSYTTAVNQIQSQVSYYNYSGGNPSKFMRNTELHIYGPNVDMPGEEPSKHAFCEFTSPSTGKSVVKVRNFINDPAWALPNWDGVISHELGHAYECWSRVFLDKMSTTPNPGNTAAKFWERMISSNHTIYNPAASPWKKADGSLEDGTEQFANSFRYFLGAAGTNGSSSSGTPNPVIPGFEDPAAHPDWKKLFQILPEAAGYWKAYGLMVDGLPPATGKFDNSIRWESSGSDKYLYYRNGAGEYIAQFSYYDYQKWNGTQWVTFAPAYSIPG